MKRDEVVWQPYHDFGELSDEFKDQLSMIYLRVPCICFNAVAYNRPDKCFRQLGLKKSELQRLSRSRSKHTKVKFSQHKGQDWRAVRPFYRKVNEEWDNRHNYSVRKSEAPQQGRQPPSHASPSHHINDSNEKCLMEPAWSIYLDSVFFFSVAKTLLMLSHSLMLSRTYMWSSHSHSLMMLSSHPKISLLMK
ncbi:unnamed protein product [Arabidopsis halleri]